MASTQNPFSTELPSDLEGTAATLLAAHVAASDPHTGYQREAEKGAANGYPGLNGSQKVTEDPANATATPTANKIPIASSGGKLDAWITGASTNSAGIVQLCTSGETSSTKAVTGTDSRLADARTPTSHATSHKHGGGDEVAASTAAANAIPKAGSGGRLGTDWLGSGSASGTNWLRGDQSWAAPTAAQVGAMPAARTSSVKTGTYGIVAGDSNTVIGGDTSSAGFTMTLPDLATNRGFLVVVKNTANSNNIQVARAGSDTIDGGSGAMNIGPHSAKSFFAPGSGTDWWTW